MYVIYLQGGWTLSVYIDNKMVAFSSGVPAIKSGGILQIHVWNHKDFVPDLSDYFNPPKTTTVLKHTK